MSVIGTYRTLVRRLGMSALEHKTDIPDQSANVR
jgi:hypothetical protein